MSFMPSHLKSHKDYLRHFRVFETFLERELFMDEFTYEDIKSYRRTKRKEGKLRLTVNKEHMADHFCLFNSFRSLED